ncbi:MAG TPA: methyltransferase [Umezawaea sp.]|nr:methyltransferase [Umezawaea sp.]
MTDTITARSDRARLRSALIERIGGHLAAHAMGLATELRVPDLIARGLRTSAELAARTGTHQPSLRRLLRVLAAVGLVSEPEPDTFELTDMGEQLCEDSPNSLYAFTRVFLHPLLTSPWQDLRHVVTTGKPAFDQAHGKDFYSCLAEQDDLSALFNVAMGEESRISAAQLAAGHDFSDARVVVDLGGGDGTLLSAVLGEHPHLSGIVFDSPSGVAEAPEVLRAAGVADRCEVRAGDFFQEIPADGDLYVIKSVFQDWDDESARTILRTCRAHLPAGATLLIVGTVLPETASADEPIPFFTDLNMLVLAGGRERTETEFRALLTATGFEVREVRGGAAGPLATIAAVPV